MLYCVLHLLKALFHSELSHELQNVLNSELKSLHNWLMANRLSLNIAKTEFMTIGSRQERAILDLQLISWDKPDKVFRPRWLVPTIELIKYSFLLYHQHGHEIIIKINEHEINRVDSVKSLGVYIDNHLTWTTHIDKFQRKLPQHLVP